MKYARILRGLAGLGAHKLGHKLEKMFEGGPKVPPGVCACTKWRSFSQPPRKTKVAGIKSAYWHKTCRGPGRTRFVVTLTQPGIKYPRGEKSADQRATHYAAEVEIDAWEAPNRGAEVPNRSADVEPNWHRRYGKHLGYFKRVEDAKRYAEVAVGQWCKKAMDRGGV